MVSLSAQSMRVLRERVPLFADFDDSELTTLMHRSRRRELSGGDVLIAEGTLATKLFIVVSGQAGVYRSLAGRSELIATLKPGATVGEVGIVDRAPRSAKVVAEGNTVILEIELSVLEESEFGMRLKLYHNLASILAGRVRATNEMLDMVAQRSDSILTDDGVLVPSLNDVSMAGVHAEGADFSSGVFTGANFENASFEGAVFANASFKGADLAGATFDEDYLIGARTGDDDPDVADTDDEEPSDVIPQPLDAAETDD
ncbi:MAG: cyclic nucleotide-binding domain-containing protein [Myxococcota bacterium]|nr:cyclic nucleotide-binding domain-containing protein [Myxococcota bacterium]